MQHTSRALRSLAAIALLSVAISAQATYCTNGATNYPSCNNQTPPPTPSTPNTSSSTSKADSSSSAAAAAAAIAGAKATGGNAAATGGKSTSNATGGAGGAANAAGGAGGNSDASSNSSSQLNGIGNSTDQSSSSFRALAISLPSPVFTPPLPISGCPQANVEQRAGSVGWGFISGAKGDVVTDNCTAIIIYNALLEQCKYKSALKVLNGLTVKVLAGYVPEDTVDLDLTRVECQALKAPVLPPPPVAAILIPPTPVACVQPAPSPVKRAVRKPAKPVAVCKS